MRLMIWSTDEVVMVQGVCCRLWHGRDLYGRRCTCFIPLLSTDDPALQHDLLQMLGQVEAPPEAVQLIQAELDARREDLGEVLATSLDTVQQAALDGHIATPQSMEEWLDETIWRCKGRSPDRRPVDLDAPLPSDDTTEVMP